jgi:large subunit ribosomal protein L25
MASTPRQYVRLAQSLPPRLTRFFARYPPQSILPAANQAAATSTIPNASNTSSTDPNAPAVDGIASSSEIPNPFRATKHPVTGRWHDPAFSLRRQAELVKLARQHGVEELLPHSVKGSVEKQKRREEHGLRVKGTGVGQKVKGKEWERTLKGRLEKRRQAMLAMPKMIAEWKQRGHGRFMKPPKV